MKTEAASFLAGQALAHRANTLKSEVEQKSQQFSSMIQELKSNFGSPEVSAKIDAKASEVRESFRAELETDIQPALEALQNNSMLARGFSHGTENIASAGTAFIRENVEQLKQL